MFKRILAPLDGSARAEQALPLAARIARASGGVLTLYQVVPMPGAYGALYVDAAGAMVNQALIDEQTTEARMYLTDLKQSAILSGIPVETVVDVGGPESFIVARSEEWNVDLIVMCSHGRSGVNRWVLGSVAEYLARHASAPVLIVREHGTLPLDTNTPQHMPLRVLVPLDGSQLAEAALEPAAKLATALTFDAPNAGAVHLTIVVDPIDVLIKEGTEKLRLEGAKDYLRHTADRLKTNHPQLTVTWSVAVNADVAMGILQVAESGEDTQGAAPFGGCDVIAMATHGRTGFNRWVVGSVAEEALHATQRPILLVRPLQTPTTEHGSAGAKEAVIANDSAKKASAIHS